MAAGSSGVGLLLLCVKSSDGFGFCGWWSSPRLLARLLLNRGLLWSTALSEPPRHTEHRPLSHIDELARNWRAGCRNTWRWGGRAAAILCSLRVSSGAQKFFSRDSPVCPAAVTAGVVLTAACSSWLACGLARDKLEARSGGCTTIAPLVSRFFGANRLIDKRTAEQKSLSTATKSREGQHHHVLSVAEARKVIQVFLYTLIVFLLGVNPGISMPARAT